MPQLNQVSMPLMRHKAVSVDSIRMGLGLLPLFNICVKSVDVNGESYMETDLLPFHVHEIQTGPTTKYMQLRGRFGVHK